MGGAINDTAATLAIVEAIGAPLLFGVVFFAFWAIGRRAAAPVELARRRQLAFTADASHELRTSLQVIEAESSLALMKDRPAVQYRDTIERMSHESIRLRRISTLLTTGSPTRNPWAHSQNVPGSGVVSQRTPPG